MSRPYFKAVLLALAAVMFLAALPASSAPPAQGFRGYCTCGCSFVKDCNTDADCGSGRCLKGPTCC
ncbi:MAG TPA: hypothetical protein VGG03_22130 [Thermoanaerobaculia bacterium]|jgi:hypothetical protein